MRYIIIALLLISCSDISKRFKSPEISTEVPDTIRIVPAKPVIAPFIFENAFVAGITVSVDSKIFQLYGVTVGKIKIASGHIIACDPMHTDEYGIPFTETFPTGEFPVQLSIAKAEDKETIAFARILFNEKIVTRWALALKPGESTLPVGDEDIHGFGVDGGVGIYIDEEANKVLDKSKVENMESDLWKELNKHYHYKWKYTMYNFAQHNLAAFSTGYGDGHYASYIGYDSAGKPCRLVSDFDVVDWRKKK